jgi:hypothetical protein
VVACSAGTLARPAGSSSQAARTPAEIVRSPPENRAPSSSIRATRRWTRWRPYQAIPLADTDGDRKTVPDPSWTPLGTTPNFPEYPSAHACHSTAVVKALDAFFGTDKVPFTLDSRVTHTTREYRRLHNIVKDVDLARVLVGFHFLGSDLQGSRLGGKVGRYVARHYFQRSGSAVQSSTAASSSASTGAPRPS